MTCAKCNRSGLTWTRRSMCDRCYTEWLNSDDRVIPSITPQGDWADRALCAQVDTEIFYPDKGGSSREAKKVCGMCDVRAECLEWALANNERFGVFGGLSEKERRRLSRGVAA